MLKAKDYIHAIFPEYSRRHPEADLSPSSGHFITLHRFCEGEKLQALFKRSKKAAEVQIGIVLDSSDSHRNGAVATYYATRLASLINAGFVEHVPTESESNKGLLRRILIDANDPPTAVAHKVVDAADRILSRNAN